MRLSEVQDAICDARRDLRVADQAANEMASLIVGRLRHVGTWTLSQLKRELRDFNMNTGRWK